eukprot:Hpha_TRINITY_DN26171_c0_g1::TRINITY_DN26171_c0_g1_i1::g.155277::m.155277/K08776/NPEPPS; puromycin-sensitive aminopeptidase
MAEDREVLSEDVIPEEYFLNFKPVPKDFYFNGDVRIRVKVQRPTHEIRVHANALLIFSGKFSSGSADLAALEIEQRFSDNTVCFRFGSELPVGEGFLSIGFRGVFNDKMSGWYRSSYKDESGQQRFLFSTQFEAADARQCFPCWDEPARKAVFNVAMEVPPGLEAISNMPAGRVETRADGVSLVTFLPTPKMSTYLVALALGEFDHVQERTEGGTLIRMITVPGKASQAQYGLRVGKLCLDFYEKFFSIPYPLSKMDMLAVPDFSAGAMENWGLVIYRECDMLCDEKTVASDSKQRIADTICHELAHQWFGNLVTMSWWDDLWLNEGFATWVARLATAELFPEWDPWEAFIVSDQLPALGLDALRSSHPIQVPIRKVEEVDEVFDTISYCKGAAVLQICFSVMGEEAFRKGLTTYLKRHQYSNTVTTDLWTALEETSGVKVGKLMGSWTEQMGFPLLRVEGEGVKVKVTQSYFTADGAVLPGDEEKKWVVPLFVGGKEGQKGGCILMEDKSLEVEVPAGWYKLNYGQSVTCRCQYPPAAFESLCKHVSELPAVDKMGLISDTFAIARAGMSCPSTIITMLDGFAQGGEDNDKVWTQLSSVLKRLGGFLISAVEELGGKDKAVLDGFNRLATKMLSPVVAKVGWDTREGDSDNVKSLRSTLLYLLTVFSGTEPSVAAEGKRRFDAYLADNNTPLVPADIRESVFAIAVQNVGADAYDALVRIHNSTEDSHLQHDIYQALAYGNAELKKRLFDFALSDHVRSQDLMFPLSALARSLTFGGGASIVFEGIKSGGYERIKERIGVYQMQYIIQISGTGFFSKEKAGEIEEFWKAKKLVGCDMTLQQTLEGILVASGFLDRLKKAITDGALSKLTA